MPEQFDIINNQTHEILKKIPKWYIRFGSIILLLVFILLIMLTTKIKYPTYFKKSGVVKNIDSSGKSYFITKIPQKYFTILPKSTVYKLSLESYPSNKYGVINITVDSILPPSNDEKDFIIYSIIGKNEVLNLNKDIKLVNNLVGDATFTIDKKSIFSQLFK